MRLLLDENLSPHLVRRLASLFTCLIHVRDIGLQQAFDEMIWDWAKANGYTIVTADADFAELSRARRWPPKAIHLEECDVPLRVIEELLRKDALRISEFDKDPRTGLLAVQFAINRDSRKAPFWFGSRAASSQFFDSPGWAPA